MDLQRRILTALAYGGIVLAAIAVPGPVFPILVAALAALAYLELVRLFTARRGSPEAWGWTLAAGFALAHLFTATSQGLALSLAAVVALIVIVAASLGHGGTYAGAAYTGWMLGFLTDLWTAGSAGSAHGWDAGMPAWLLLALVPTWSADITSFAVGSLVGQHTLAPRISPGKTWEGTISGFVAAAFMAFAVGALFGLPRGAVALVAVALGPVGLAGDLLESSLKRRVGAKDSGSLLPGHGGVLDRIDSLITVAPLVTLAAYLGGGLG